MIAPTLVLYPSYHPPYRFVHRRLTSSLLTTTSFSKRSTHKLEISPTSTHSLMFGETKQRDFF